MYPKTMLLNPKRLTCLLLLLFFVAGRDSTASYQGGYIRDGECNAASSGEALPVNVLADTSAVENRHPGGQKMANRVEKEKENEESGERTKLSTESLNIEDQLISTLRSLLSKKRDVSGFVAFNADYSVPRYHPPKNN